MNICFVLPVFTRQPQGGYKMVFEYANRLTEKNHKVKILFLNDIALRKFCLPEPIRKLGANILTAIEPRWFHLDRRVEKISGYHRNLVRKLSDIDIAIATSVNTVAPTKKLFASIPKAYFIQDYETWICDEDVVQQSYRDGLINIVISNYLKDIVEKYAGKQPILIKNPVDINFYKVIKPIESRKKHSVSLLYHTKEHKGVKYALEALNALREKYPDLNVEMFGIFPAPVTLPSWIHYTKGATPEQVLEIYNATAVYLCATVEEGYGLTGLEAMSCGTALVSTGYRGVYEYARSGENALLSPVKDVDALVRNISMLFDNQEKRILIAKAGVESVQKGFGWERAVDLFERALENGV